MTINESPKIVTLPVPRFATRYSSTATTPAYSATLLDISGPVPTNPEAEWMISPLALINMPYFAVPPGLIVQDPSNQGTKAGSGLRFAISVGLLAFVFSDANITATLVNAFGFKLQRLVMQNSCGKGGLTQVLAARTIRRQ